jgi:three-Cys-motif partner protein
LAKKHYDYQNGLAELDDHSVTKHKVLVEYLIRYFEQRTLNARGREKFKITLVDGFCGAGQYQLKSSGDVVLGSPLHMIKAVEEAQIKVNAGRTKPLILEVQYIFVDKNSRAISHLREVLKTQGYENLVDSTIHLICSEFGLKIDEILKRIHQHTPRASTALFFLDQYGYAEVPAPLIQKIFKELNNAEVVLTFHVSSFATYTNDELVDKVSKTLKVDIFSRLGGKSIEQIKANDADWRRFIQGALYEALVKGCGAKYFTPFFIRGAGAGHGEYWLVHLSQHHRAQDVMKQVHWQHHNHFVHYGGAGLDMLAPHTMGYMQEFDGGFRFDDVAQNKSDTALLDQLGKRISEQQNSQSIGDLYANTCNTSPSTNDMYKNVLEKLVAEKTVIVSSEDGKPRNYARYMTDKDIIEVSPQKKLFLPSKYK